MNAETMKTLCHEYRELQRMQEDLTAELEALRAQIIEHMDTAEIVTAGEYRISYKAVTSSRLDSTALKKELPDIAARFMKTTTSRRFVIS